MIKRSKPLKQITPCAIALPHDGPGQPDTIIGIRQQGRYAFDCAQGCAQHQAATLTRLNQGHQLFNKCRQKIWRLWCR
jgi:hypothetical protein